MKKRFLRDLEVSSIGFGCMGFSHGYGSMPERNESIRLIRQAYDLGCTFFDTAEGYGIGSNEELVREALKPIRDKAILGTKFNIAKDSAVTSKEMTLQRIRTHVEASLKRLGTEYIDQYYQHRVNKDIPVKEIAYCMGELIKEGKILGWG